MNREERRSLKKQGASEKTIANMSQMNSPCTITETVQIARGVAQDVLTDYHRTQGNIQLSLSVQLELMRNIMIEKGLMTEEEFRQMYADKIKEIQQMQEQADNMPTMSAKANDIEVKVEE